MEVGLNWMGDGGEGQEEIVHTWTFFIFMDSHCNGMVLSDPHYLYFHSTLLLHCCLFLFSWTRIAIVWFCQAYIICISILFVIIVGLSVLYYRVHQITKWIRNTSIG